MRLKLNFNSTRRAAWHAKLGYQRFVSNMVLNVAGSHPSGGTISGVKVYIARVYPLRYYDSTDGVKVWRNSKAEKYEAQNWEVDNFKTLDEIRSSVCQEFEKRETSTKKLVPSSYNKISEINCPKTLYELLESSNDPDSLGAQLSVTQKETVRNYQQMLVDRKQREVEEIIRERIGKKNKGRRNVSAVLPATIFDCNDSSFKKYNFNIWAPKEGQVEQLREGIVVTMYNLVSK